MEASNDKHRLDIVSKVNEAAVYYPDPLDTGEVYPEEVRSLYHSHHIPCPFLSEAGTCLVYGVRPAICRTHMTFSGSDNCKTNDRVAMYEAYYLPQLFTAINLLSRLVYEDIEHDKHIGQWFLDEFRF
jgi:Fe-S-cluster containining protein